MKKIKNLDENSFLKLFFLFVSLCFVVAAFILPDRARAFSGLLDILFSTCKVSTNYFAGGYAATFLNMGLVGLFCWALCLLPGAKATLSAAAMTYVAALASSLASLLRLILIFNRRR